MRGPFSPPAITAYPSWPTIYLYVADGLDVLAEVGAAVAWFNERVGQAVAAYEA